MVTGDWGVDDDFLADRAVLDSLLAAIESDDASDLPGVQAAGDQGFEPAPDAPLWVFLPAVWPREARAWVPDRRVRTARVVSGDGSAHRVPWSAADYAEAEADASALLRACGLPPRPAGRVWLLRPLAGLARVADVLAVLTQSAEAAGIAVAASEAFAAHVQRELEVLRAST